MAWKFMWQAPSPTTDSGLELPYPMDIVRFRSFIGASGPPYNVVSEEVPFRPGSYLKTITVDDAQVMLTMINKGTSKTSLWQSLQPLPALFNPTRVNGVGNFGGRLLVSTPASSAIKFLQCVCISGFRVDESTLQDTMVESTLEFYANYPYWQSLAENTVSGSPFGTGPEWFPIFPLILGGGGSFIVDLVVNNAGDVPSYPTIIVNGPGDQPRITNQTLPIGAGYFPLTANGGVTLANNTQSVTIDMLNRTVIRNNGDNEINKLDYTGTFWALAPGNNTIRLRIDEPPTLTAQTSITIIWRDTYSGVI